MQVNAIVERIMQLVLDKGMTGTELGKLLGLKKSPLTDWKNNKSKPTLEQALLICDFFGISTDFLFKDGEYSNQQITTGNISNSGALGIHNHAPTTLKNGVERELTKQEQDLLRIYNIVDGKKQMEIMKFVYDIED